MILISERGETPFSFLLSKRDALNVCLIIFVYSVAWLFLLLNVSGIYWDDWTLFNQADDAVQNTFRRAGAPITGFVHAYLQSIGNGVFPYRVIVFLSYLIVSLSVYFLLKKSELVELNGALVIALIIAVFPVNQARIALINAPYAYSLAIFFVAFVLMTIENSHFKVVARLLSLVLFFFSFFVMSLLVFYLVSFVFMMYMQRAIWFKGIGWGSLLSAMRWLVSSIDYILIPFVFFAIKAVYFLPSEIYSEENHLSHTALIMSVPYVVDNLFLFFWLPMERLLEEVTFLSVIGVVCFCFILLQIKNNIFDVSNSKNHYCLLFLGVVLLFLAAYPYVVVGKVPSLVDWESRHQLLFPFGSALVIFSVVNIFIKKNIRAFVFTLLIFSAVVRDSKDMLDYHLDSLKQDAIIHQLSRLDELKNTDGNIVLFDDLAHSYNAMNRSYRFYEFNGWMKRAFNDQTRLGEYVGRASAANKLIQYSPYREYNFHQFDKANASVAGKVTIQAVTMHADDGYVFRIGLVFKKLFFMDSYNEIRDNYITVRFDEVGRF